MKHVIITFTLIIFLVLAGSLIALRYFPTRTIDAPFVMIGETRIPVEIAKDKETQRKGLSGRDSLAADSGMLFDFGSAKRWGIWMPNMNFSIDIIWIQEGRVVDFVENASPSATIPPTVTYTPREAASYVLEVNSGFVARNEIAINDPVQMFLTQEK